MKLTIAGTGYVGLVTGTGFANLGNDILCFDIDNEKISLRKRDYEYGNCHSFGAWACTC